MEENKSRREIILINRSEIQSADKWTIVERVSKVLSIAAIPVVLAVGGWIIQRQLQDQTVNRDYVQLAVSILKESDTTKIKPQLRDWAVDLLNANSPTKFSDEVAKQLKSGETTLPTNFSALLQSNMSGHPMAISPDGKLALIGNEDGSARILDLVNGTEFHTLKGHVAAITSVAFSPDARIALTGSLDTTARAWDVATGQELMELRGHTDIVTGVASSPDGKIVLTGSLDGTVKQWDIHTGQLLRSFSIDIAKP
jgi:WD40 repeat protein